MIWLEIRNNKNWPTKVKQQQSICISSTHTHTHYTPWLYSPCRTLASFMTVFQSSLLCASSSGPPSHRPSTLTLVFLHPYFLLECSGINLFTTLSSCISSTTVKLGQNLNADSAVWSGVLIPVSCLSHQIPFLRLKTHQRKKFLTFSHWSTLTDIEDHPDITIPLIWTLFKISEHTPLTEQT
jgi:hypothetical protein